MIQIKIHGRGGQGAVTAAYLLAIAGFKNKFYTQAFPKFGTERTGSPVESYVRLSKNKIITRSPIKEPDYVLVLDPSLKDVVNVFEGVKKSTLVIINTNKKIEYDNCKVITIDLSEIMPDINTSKMLNVGMISAFLAITDIININNLLLSLKEIFNDEILNKNKYVAEKIYTEVRKEMLKI